MREFSLRLTLLLLTSLLAACAGRPGPELLARQYFGEMNERQLEYSSAILDSAQNLILMIGDVIDVAAIEAGDAAAARQAAAGHMSNAIVRIRQADAGFWQNEAAYQP